MEFLAPLANLLGVTVSQLQTWVIIIAVLVVGWWVVKTVVKFAVRTFAAGCLVILLFGAGLYIYFAVL